MIGLYFHIPFCKKKCGYCNFASLPEGKWDIRFLNRYCEALQKEIKLEEEKNLPVDTIYFGGGTPSMLSPESIAAILGTVRECYDVSPECEITLEVNPGTVVERALEGFRKVGINRISIGVQSLSNETLKTLGRIHRREDASSTLKWAGECGFTSLSVDLILGTPFEKEKDWYSTVEEIASFRPHHVSLYILTPEPETPLGGSILDGAVSMPDDEALSAMMDRAREILASSGYIHYEISNFALPGFECRHNHKYWSGEEYRGFGASACSYRRLWRFRNTKDPFSYAGRIERGENPLEFAERLSKMRQMGEYAMLCLRTAQGIYAEDFKNRFKVEIMDIFGGVIENLRVRGLLKIGSTEETGGYCVYVPVEHWIVHNEIVESFIIDGSLHPEDGD